MAKARANNSEKFDEYPFCCFFKEKLGFSIVWLSEDLLVYWLFFIYFNCTVQLKQSISTFFSLLLQKNCTERSLVSCISDVFILPV